jgi:hypothetical protein
MQDIPEISLLKVRFRMWKGAGGFETLTFKKNDFLSFFVKTPQLPHFSKIPEIC